MPTSRSPTGTGWFQMDLQDGGQTAGQENAAALDAHQRDLGAVYVALGDFVGDAGQGAPHGRGVRTTWWA